MLAERAHQRGVECLVVIDACRCPARSRATRCAWARCSTTWSATPSSSPSGARSPCWPDRVQEDVRSVTVRFEVRDTGIGIAPEQLARPVPALHAGRRVHHPQVSAARASGSAISKQLVELLGGEIGASSEPGRGSVLLVHRAPGEGPGRRRRAAPRGRRAVGPGRHARAGGRRQRLTNRADPARTSWRPGRCAPTTAATGAQALQCLRGGRRAGAALSPGAAGHAHARHGRPGAHPRDPRGRPACRHDPGDADLHGAQRGRGSPARGRGRLPGQAGAPGRLARLPAAGDGPPPRWPAAARPPAPRAPRTARTCASCWPRTTW